MSDELQSIPPRYRRSMRAFVELMNREQPGDIAHQDISHALHDSDQQLANGTDEWRTPLSLDPAARTAASTIRIHTISDLAIFNSPHPPYPTHAIPPATTLAKLCLAYNLTVKIDWRMPAGEPVRCRCPTTRGTPCGLPLFDHDAHDAHHRHAYPRAGAAVLCPWPDCHEPLPPRLASRVAAGKDVNLPLDWCTHFSIIHFRMVALCDLCGCDLMSPPNWPGRPQGCFLRDEHLRSGWCVGLAKHAMRHSMPVPLPQVCERR